MLRQVNLYRSLELMALSTFVLVALTNSSTTLHGERVSLRRPLYSKTWSSLVGDFPNFPAKDQVAMSAPTIFGQGSWFGLSTPCRIPVNLVATHGAPMPGRIEWGRTFGRQ